MSCSCRADWLPRPGLRWAHLDRVAMGGGERRIGQDARALPRHLDHLEGIFDQPVGLADEARLLSVVDPAGVIRRCLCGRGRSRADRAVVEIGEAEFGMTTPDA